MVDCKSYIENSWTLDYIESELQVERIVLIVHDLSWDPIIVKKTLVNY